MKYLTLIRHAKSDWKDSSLSDHDRTLNDRGLRTAPIVGRFLARTYLGANGVPRLLPQPSVMVSSTATRALTTAQLIRPELNMPEQSLVLDERAYLAEPKALLHIVRAFDDSWPHVVLVGHNPGISEFSRKLLRRGNIEEMPTCSATLIELPWDAWAATEWNEARLIGYVTPKLIEKRFAGEMMASEV